MSPSLVLALDSALGQPVDGYLNGTQVWLTSRDEGSVTTDVALEWRLHPVGGYRPPDRLSHHELWEEVVGQLASGSGADTMTLGGEHRALTSLWDGLECFPLDDGDAEPAVLARIATEALGIAPDATGLVDHELVGATWERARRQVSLVELVLAELRA